MKAKAYGLLAALLLTSSHLTAMEDADFDTDTAFDMRQLPEGHSVTLPSPATTLVPLATYYRVSPTDHAQVFRLSSPRAACAVMIQVFDKRSEAVKTSTLKAGESLIYRFDRFNGVRVHAEAAKNCSVSTRLVLDSNRPLEIGMLANL